MVTQSELKKLFNYNPITGVFTRLISTSSRAKKGYVLGIKNTKNQYLNVRIKNKTYLLHRLAWLYSKGYLPIQIDHINGIKNDNRLCNLRSVNNAENQRNKPIPSSNTSGCVGVYKSRWNTWIVRVKINRKQKYFGSYKNKKEAILARKEADKIYGFHEKQDRPKEKELCQRKKH